MSEVDSGIEKETISFYPDKTNRNYKNIEINYTISGSTFKLQLPVFNEGTPEEFLHFIHEFEQAKGKLSYNSAQKLESGLEQLLQGNASNEWSTIKGKVVPGTTTLTSFNERIESFKRLYISDPSTINNQRNYLQRVRKNDWYTVPQFLDRLKHINMLLCQLPSASDSDCFNATELKQIFYNSMPIWWRTNFINSGQSLFSLSIESLQTYMVQQENQTDAHRRKARDGNKKNQNKQPFKLNRGKKPLSKFNNNHKDQSKDIKKEKLANEDDCPIHGSSHKWGQCHQNQ